MWNLSKYIWLSSCWFCLGSSSKTQSILVCEARKLCLRHTLQNRPKECAFEVRICSVVRLLMNLTSVCAALCLNVQFWGMQTVNLDTSLLVYALIWSTACLKIWPLFDCRNPKTSLLLCLIVNCSFSWPSCLLRRVSLVISMPLDPLRTSGQAASTA